MAFSATVVTPERILVETEVSAVNLRTADGEAAFLPGHTPVIGSVVAGLVRLEQTDGTELRLAVHGGFVHVENDRVELLAPVAERSDEIDVARAQRAAEAAEVRIAELRGAEAGDRDLADAEAALRRAQDRLAVAGG